MIKKTTSIFIALTILLLSVSVTAQRPWGLISTTTVAGGATTTLRHMTGTTVEYITSSTQIRSLTTTTTSTTTSTTNTTNPVVTTTSTLRITYTTVVVKLVTTTLPRKVSSYRKMKQFNSKVAVVLGIHPDNIRSVQEIDEEGSKAYNVRRYIEGMIFGLLTVRFETNVIIDEGLKDIIREEKPWWTSYVRVYDSKDNILHDDYFCNDKEINSRCYDGLSDQDGDCHMSKDAVDSICGYDIIKEYNDQVFFEWMDEYPWDCDDHNKDKSDKC